MCVCVMLGWILTWGLALSFLGGKEARLDNEPIVLDVSNVPMLSDSFHRWDKLFPTLVHSFREVVIEEDVGSFQVHGSIQNSHAILKPQELDQYRYGSVIWAGYILHRPLCVLHLKLCMIHLQKNAHRNIKAPSYEGTNIHTYICWVMWV